ncbi:cell division cycle 20.2, cofactor of APC complex [Aplysia californica]|uniref:Cell division cycle 20.2, cofactor of APC complex n=1 Tax=Aplysia californica TaxID=6500 RepID=A0ABM1A9M1_APLCA|nr:cell division cycle 20.2, cofactor of APC complex [Aplysia californica]
MAFGADRFIPFRPRLDLDFAHGFCTRSLGGHGRASDTVSDQSDHDGEEEGSVAGPAASSLRGQTEDWKQYRRQLDQAFGHSPGAPVLPLSPTWRDHNWQGADFSFSKVTRRSDQSGPCLYNSGVTSCRQVPRDPDRVLALPGIQDNFYCKGLDWGSHNSIAAALGSSTCVWSPHTRLTARLDARDDHHGRQDSSHVTGTGSAAADDRSPRYVASVKWSEAGGSLAVGLSQGMIQLWDPGSQKIKATVSVGGTHVGCLCWSGHVVYCGARRGYITTVDERVKRAMAVWRPRDRFEVSSLELSPCERNLASGSNDGYIRTWCPRTGSVLLEVDAHMSAIKALSWCPWRRDLLASGGGARDRRLVLWHMGRGQAEVEINTETQICDIVWSEQYRELVSSHGYPNNDLRLWSVRPGALQLMTSLRHHKGRPLHLAMSPDRSRVAAAATDETLSLWTLFPNRRTQELRKWRSPLDLVTSIR